MKRSISLQWAGKPESFKEVDPFFQGRSSPIYRYEDEKGRHLFLYGDNLNALFHLKPMAKKVRLAYLDPPFLTGRLFEKKDRDSGKKCAAYSDRWEDRATYLQSIGERLSVIRELLTEDGSVVIHVDPKTSHYVRVLADEIFGEDCFASEIVWRYRRWPAKQKNFQRVHDVLLRYRKNSQIEPVWNQLYEKPSASTLATWGTGKQRAIYDQNGSRCRSSTLSELSPGVPLGDVWEIGIVAPVSKERTGYPSQKPELLLSRLILALTMPGDYVLDPYAGSGTTLATADKLGRRFIGIDNSSAAFETIVARMEKCGVKLKLQLQDDEQRREIA